MPPGHSLLKKAPRFGAFFLLVAWLSAAAADACSPPATAQPVQIRYVHDGDTLILRDDTRVRLIGINTPEVARKGQPAEALAVKARNRLRQLLFQHDNRARLVYGKQKQDPHGRSLAHLWLADDSNLAARLLAEGLGWSIAIPPNIRFLDCYREAEETARTASLGVWKRADYAATPSTELRLRDTGFRRVRGRVIRVNRGGGATWINLEGRFAVRTPDRDMQYFRDHPDNSWLGREIELSGWLYAAKGELRVNIHHPAALRLSP